MDKARQVYDSAKRPVAQGFTHGVSMASAAGFIQWAFTLGGIAVPTMAAAFMAGCLVPVIQYFLNKLES